MKLAVTAWSLMVGTAIALAPAHAQYGSTPQPQQPTQPSATTQATTSVNVSKGAFKAISELEAAVKAKDLANIPARLAAAEAVARTKDDRYMVDLLRFRAAVALDDPAAIERAVGPVLASGRMPAGFDATIYADLGKLYYGRKQFDQAAAAFERSLGFQPTNTETMAMLAEARNSQGRAADAVALLQKAIAQTRAAGQTPNEKWYRRSIGIAAKAKLPNTPQLTRDWLQAYPTSTNWRDSLLLYRQSASLDEAALLDLFRLSRATRSLASEKDFYDYADLALLRGFPGEAKAVLEEGFAAKLISRSKPEFASLISSASARSAGDRASLEASAKAALAAPTAKQAVTVGDAYYGYGDYAKAAQLYRAALAKSGADTSLVNLRLGAALALSGDKAGATQAFNAVSGQHSEIARFWLIHLATKA